MRPKAHHASRGRPVTVPLNADDADDDGVPDVVDQCLTTTPGSKVDLRGCALPSDDARAARAAIDQCVGAQAKVLVAELKARTISGTQFLKRLYEIVAECEGKARDEDAAVSQARARYQWERLFVLADLLRRGDLRAYQKSTGCLLARYPALFPEQAAVCVCTEDEDADRVNDCEDRCPGTPAGKEVDAVGCPVTGPSPTRP